MGTISQLAVDKFRAQIRIKGHPSEAKTWATKEEAEKWINDRETELRTGKSSQASGAIGITIGKLIDQYVTKKEKTADIHKSIKTALRAIKADMGHVILAKLTDQNIIDYIEGRGVGAATGQFHFAALRAVLKMAEIGFGYYVPQVLDKARDRMNYLALISKSNERERRPTTEELEKLYAYDWRSKMPMVDIIKFAIATTMRVSEITRIEHGTRQKSRNSDEMETIMITDRKHPKKKKGNNQRVPLLPEAVEIVERQPKLDFDERVFPFDCRNISNRFAIGCKELGIEDLHFHDLRHEAASRLFERGYKIEQVALYTGHKDWKMLERYTHLKAENLQHLEAPRAVVKEEPAKAVEGGVTISPEQFAQFQQFQAMMAMMQGQKAA